MIISPINIGTTVRLIFDVPADFQRITVQNNHRTSKAQNNMTAKYQP